MALVLGSGTGAGVMPAVAGDWPTWRYDANRSAASTHELPAHLHLQWKRELPPPRPAFPEDVRLCFDISYEPVVMGKTMFVPSMVADSVTAINVETGAKKWTFYADGPVRFAPVAWEGKVFFVSDDGCLYCVGAEDGELAWKFSGTPSGQDGSKLLGDGRLVSRWAARGGPVLLNGTVYFAAGVWPFEGTFVYAIDAQTGRQVWANKECGLIKDGLIDHGTRRDGGLSPQGYLAVIGDRLIVPSGRSLPAIFDLKSGKMEPYTSGWGGRDGLAKGCWYVSGIGDYLFQSGDVYALAARAAQIAGPREAKEVWSFDEFAEYAGVSLETVRQWAEKDLLETVEQDGSRFIRVPQRPSITYVSWVMGKGFPGEQHAVKTRPRLQIDPANDKALGLFREPILTKDAIYYSEPSDDEQGGRDRWPRKLGYGGIVACDITKASPGVSCESGWGEPVRLVVWENLRFDPLWSLPSELKVHIKAGPRLYAGCTGVVAAIEIPDGDGEPKVSWESKIDGTPSRMLAADHKLFVVTKEGSLYCFGPGQVEPKSYAETKTAPSSVSNEWTMAAAEILKQTGAAEGYCLALGLGTGRLIEELARRSKLHIIALDPDRSKVDAARQRFDSMGLYGTRIHVLPGSLSTLELPSYIADLAVSEDLQSSGLEQGTQFIAKLFRSIRPYGGVACLPTSGTADSKLRDWVEEANLDGADVRRAGDYTLLTRLDAPSGSQDWSHESGDAGNTFSSNDDSVKPPFRVLWYGGAADEVTCRGHAPVISRGRMFVAANNALHAFDIYSGRLLWKGALPGPRTPNEDIVALPNCVYVLCGTTCLRIDSSTGNKLGEIAVPETGKKARSWGDIRILGDYFIGSSGSRLYCLDRHNGKLLWKLQGQRNRHGFAVGNNKVFSVNYWAPSHQRRGADEPNGNIIYAVEVSDGKVVWQTTSRTPDETAEGKGKTTYRPLAPQLAYCEAGDIVLLTAIDRAVAAYQGSSGEVLWDKAVPCRGTGVGGYKAPILLPDMLIPHAGTIYDPRTGLPLPKQQWEGMKVRARGCGRALANKHMVTFRDAHASYFDLATGRLSYLRGIRLGCTNSLIPAGGILNAPNFAQQCTCNWPIYVSFALVPADQTGP